ncbi:MAG TPA: 16S rRNA (adenine(1518)-N(6)/adenine(1519)-N(6))-dimethyltransferase RsmA [Candidatus Saccharimonadales bacterium]|nr:16S rRNA (adenine(1518)-N(6)/adenine(1519)-N(6))-dimethyltransferase RsmA [Candidatus Saccharimonadales bacterium]
MQLPFGKKSLGQHWLTDQDSLDAIHSAAEITPSDVVLEIGPGLGTLTELLVLSAKEVVAVEFDRELAQLLPERLSAGNLKVIHQDILSYDLTELPEGYKVVANIPYYLTSHLLRRLSESPNPPHRMVLLLQKEVAERVAAKPGDMSMLSVATQYYYQPELDRVVTSDLFTPPPKVDSQILKLTKHSQPIFPDIDDAHFFRVVKAGFSNRRKTLLNSLSGGLHKDKREVATILDKADVDPRARPQNLTLNDWHRISKLVKT